MMVERDAFGIPVPPAEGEEDEFAFLRDPAPDKPAETAEDAPAPEAPAEEPAPAAPAAAPEEPVAPETETPEQEQVRLYAKRYDTVEKLEDGYQELRELHRRTAERAKAYEDQLKTVTDHAQQLEQIVQRAIPYVQEQARQQQQQQTQPQYDEYGNLLPQTQMAPTPEQLQQFVDQQVQYRMGQAQSEWQQQAAADAEAEAARNAVMGFFEKHPDVEMNGPIDDQIALTIHALNDAWTNYNSSVDITDPDSLEVAYEAAKRPALRHVLEKNPALFDDEQGMQLARFQASILEGQPITQSAQTVPASSAQIVGSPRPPTLERAATTSNSPDDRPLDEVDQAFLEYRQSKQRGGGVFFE
jgi:hypothetical protein